MREDGLAVANMNVSYGGAVTTMHNTVIREVGTHTPTLNVGNVQTMVFKEHDAGPF